MSNFDLLDWSKYLKIPLKHVLSRDERVPHNLKLGLFIYNLESANMSGSHWVATYVRDNVINYFDSFGMPPFQEMVNHAKRKNLTLLHQNQLIQNLYTTICGYFCLYCKVLDIHKAIEKLPKPQKGWVPPGYNYAGPYNLLHKQLKHDER